jgi:hypothetical protein
MSSYVDPAHEESEAREIAAAAREAAAIGGRAGDENLDPAWRPLIEAGGGVAEGFELAEEQLIEAAEHTDSRVDPLADQFPPEEYRPVQFVTYGEADHERSSEAVTGDR